MVQGSAVAESFCDTMIVSDGEREDGSNGFVVNCFVGRLFDSAPSKRYNLNNAFGWWNRSRIPNDKSA